MFPKATGNRILLETDFLPAADMVLDLKNRCWFFDDNPDHKYPFGKDLTFSPGAMYNDIFEPMGEATTILEHHIRTVNP